MSTVIDRTEVDPRTSYRMSRVPSRDTEPELAVRRALHRLGYRFRLHRSDLPGSPDVVLPRFKTVVFVHGCFWHGHGCKRARLPKRNTPYWDLKIRKTKARDRSASEKLRELGWRTHLIWTCDVEAGVQRLVAFLRRAEM